MRTGTFSKPKTKLQRSTIAFFLAVLISTGGAPGWIAQAALADKIFDVRQYGARGDGKALDTSAIQKALDACGNGGGGTVLFPSGKYLSKPIFLRSRTILELSAGAILQATDERADFANPEKTNSFIAFINGRDLKEVVITGPGTIDGAGGRWWGPAEAARRKTPGYVLPRPSLVVLSNCNNVRVQDITLQNSPLTHLAPTACENVVISNVVVQAPAQAANTDAIDPINCKNVLITRCRMEVGDDNVSIKSTQAIPGRVSSEDITVTDCIFLHGHGMSVGAATIGGVKNVTVRNCVFKDTENGIRIKSRRGRGGIVENIRFSDITMTNVDPAITFTCYYMNNSSGDPVERVAPEHDLARPVNETTPVFRNISVSNLTATCPKSAGMIIGLPESEISGVVLDHVTITAATTGFAIKNAKAIRLKDVTIYNRQGPPIILENAQVDGIKRK